MYSFTIPSFILVTSPTSLAYRSNAEWFKLNYNNPTISLHENCLCLWLSQMKSESMYTHLSQIVREYMHASACIHLHGRMRARKWHVDTKPTRAVPNACFSVTLHLHLTPILEIPQVALRGLAQL